MASTPGPAVLADLLGPPRLTAPQSLFDLVNFQLHLIENTSAGIVTRLCEGEFGITRREWRLIALLQVGGPQAPSQLALNARLDRSRTSKALKPLLDKQLVQRQGHPADGRRATVALTAQGHALYTRLFPQVARINTALLAVLDAAEVELLTGLLTRLRQRAQVLAASGLVDAVADRRGGGSRQRWRAVAGQDDAA